MFTFEMTHSIQYNTCNWQFLLLFSREKKLQNQSVIITRRKTNSTTDGLKENVSRITHGVNIKFTNRTKNNWIYLPKISFANFIHILGNYLASFRFSKICLKLLIDNRVKKMYLKIFIYFYRKYIYFLIYLDASFIGIFKLTHFYFSW